MVTGWQDSLFVGKEVLIRLSKAFPKMPERTWAMTCVVSKKAKSHLILNLWARFCLEFLNCEMQTRIVGIAFCMFASTA